MLSLSRMNISMDITPHSGISFSASQASAINSSLISHKIQFSPTLVGDYKLVNFTWFEAPAPSQGECHWCRKQVLSAFHLCSAVEPDIAIHKSMREGTSPLFMYKGKMSNYNNYLPCCLQCFHLFRRIFSQKLQDRNGKLSGRAAVVLIAAIISVLIICSCALREEKAPDPYKEVVKPRILEAASSGGSLPHPASTRFLSYEELKEATSNFESASILGEGGFGKVYRGIFTDWTTRG